MASTMMERGAALAVLASLIVVTLGLATRRAPDGEPLRAEVFPDAVLECLVSAERLLQDCRVIRISHAARGQERAALFAARDSWQPNSPFAIPGRRISAQVVWQPRPPGQPLSKPILRDVRTAGDARRVDIVPFVMVGCRVQPDYSVTRCEILLENPPGSGLGQIVLREMDIVQVQPDPRKVGRVVHLTRTFPERPSPR